MITQVPHAALGQPPLLVGGSLMWMVLGTEAPETVGSLPITLLPESWERIAPENARWSRGGPGNASWDRGGPSDERWSVI